MNVSLMVTRRKAGRRFEVISFIKIWPAVEMHSGLSMFKHRSDSGLDV